MKTLLTIFTLVFTVMFSSTSFGGWTKVTEDVDGKTYYVDFEGIRKHGGYVYFWELVDQPQSKHFLSIKVYKQGDCRLFGHKVLMWSFHHEPMGEGQGKVDKTPEKEWYYPPPDTVLEIILKSVCSR